jgi:hypothetical protein
MNVHEAIQRANEMLPGLPAPDGDEDPRWRAIIAVSEHIEAHPGEIWDFAKRWGCHPMEDVRTAVATCILEHFLEHHFDSMFSQVEELAKSDLMFANTLSMCWKFGQTEDSVNATRFDRLLQETAR